MTSGTLSSILGSSAPIGSIIQAPYNLVDPAWLPCDGRNIVRATYPRFSACQPNIGTFTPTARTRAAASTGAALATDGTSWVLTGTVGTTNIYTTPDAVTFTGRTTPASCDIRSILYDGTNFVAANAVAGGGAMQYSSNAGVTWNTSATATVGAIATTLQTCMTWASSLGTIGRFCLTMGTSGAGAIYTSDDRGVTWTSRTATGAGNLFHVCWTGQKYIATGSTVNTILISSDGITWTAQTLPFATTAATATTGALISDGNGKILYIDANVSNNSRIFVSMDHGVTWARRAFGDIAGLIIWGATVVPNYTNGRFVVSTGNGGNTLLWSSDLIGWVISGDIPVNSSAIGISFKNGTYFNTQGNGTSSQTVVEDLTKIQLPSGTQGGGPIGATTSFWNNFMPFIKVQ